MNDVDGNDDYYDGGNGADGRNVCVWGTNSYVLFFFRTSVTNQNPTTCNHHAMAQNLKVWRVNLCSGVTV